MEKEKGLLRAHNLIYQMFSNFYIFNSPPGGAKWVDSGGTTVIPRCNSIAVFIWSDLPNGNFKGDHICDQILVILLEAILKTHV